MPPNTPTPTAAVACHFLANQSNGKLVVLHHGHDCQLNDGSSLYSADDSYGLYRTIYGLLRDGFSVMGVYMPKKSPADCAGGDPHPDMVNFIPTGSGSSLRYFLDPTLGALNYAKGLMPSRYSEYHMIGLSGGGWTTVWYSALDPSIKTSISVAGSLPFEFWPGSHGEDEQVHPPYYSQTGYRDLYVLGAQGFGRRQIHILNRHDTCCFTPGTNGWQPSTAGPWVSDVRAYETQIRSLLVNLGGMLRVEIDEAPTQHTISRNAVTNVILAELEGARTHIGAVDDADAFVRGGNGNIWRFNNNTWSDTGLAAVGVPAVVHVSGGNSIDIFYRDSSNQLRHAFPGMSGWTVDSNVSGTIISDPVAVSSTSGRWDAVAWGSDYLLYHWSSAFSGSQQISTTASGVGRLSMFSAAGNQLDLFLRGQADGVFHMEFNGTSWSFDTLFQWGTNRGFPSAVVTTELVLVRGQYVLRPTRRVYSFGHDDRLYENSKVGSGSWSNWQSLSNVVGQSGLSLVGSPTASASGSYAHVATRTTASNLAIFSLNGSWSFTDLGPGVAGAPTAVQPSGAWIRGNSNGLWRNDGSGYVSKGGVFE